MHGGRKHGGVFPTHSSSAVHGLHHTMRCARRQNTWRIFPIHTSSAVSPASHDGEYLKPCRARAAFVVEVHQLPYTLRVAPRSSRTIGFADAVPRLLREPFFHGRAAGEEPCWPHIRLIPKASDSHGPLKTQTQLDHLPHVYDTMPQMLVII